MEHLFSTTSESNDLSDGTHHLDDPFTLDDDPSLDGFFQGVHTSGLSHSVSLTTSIQNFVNTTTTSQFNSLDVVGCQDSADSYSVKSSTPSSPYTTALSPSSASSSSLNHSASNSVVQSNSNSLIHDDWKHLVFRIKCASEEEYSYSSAFYTTMFKKPRKYDLRISGRIPSSSTVELRLFLDDDILPESNLDYNLYTIDESERTLRFALLTLSQGRKHQLFRLAVIIDGTCVFKSPQGFKIYSRAQKRQRENDTKEKRKQRLTPAKRRKKITTPTKEMTNSPHLSLCNSTCTPATPNQCFSSTHQPNSLITPLIPLGPLSFNRDVSKQALLSEKRVEFVYSMIKKFTPQERAKIVELCTQM